MHRSTMEMQKRIESVEKQRLEQKRPSSSGTVRGNRSQNMISQAERRFNSFFKSANMNSNTSRLLKEQMILAVSELSTSAKKGGRAHSAREQIKKIAGLAGKHGAKEGGSNAILEIKSRIKEKILQEKNQVEPRSARGPRSTVRVATPGAATGRRTIFQAMDADMKRREVGGRTVECSTPNRTTGQNSMLVLKRPKTPNRGIIQK